MIITPNFLQECEDQVAKGNTSAAIESLQAIKGSTAYKNEIISLNNRWKKFSRERMNGTLSNDEQVRQNNKVNNDLLLLLEALRKELGGEEVISDLFQTDSINSNSWHPLTQTYIPILLTALVMWGITYFAYRQPDPICNQPVDLNGNWTVLLDLDSKNEKLGDAKITQNKCLSQFQVSGALMSVTTPGHEVDFSSRIGSFDDGEIIFVYENFEGERGVCRGIIPASNANEFTMHCIDLIGFNKDERSNVELIFRRAESGH